ncbi:hypothetical protein N9R28_00920 [Flavobacteriaceae bacterium]|jgi:hypothetical protein|nr:hypothetical protein [Flavobacteriaceae bacterium]|tara:strand:+ start:270 stop:488 length:219 start_codon:yes stop_codon:yes gene_type:complete
MQIEVYFSYSFVSPNSTIYKVKDSSIKPSIIETSATTLKDLTKKGWRLGHAIKTSQSAQLESFNFLLVLEKE